MSPEDETVSADGLSNSQCIESSSSRLYGDSFDKDTQTLFSSEAGAATPADLAEKIKSGDIKFAEGAQVFFVGVILLILGLILLRRSFPRLFPLHM